MGFSGEMPKTERNERLKPGQEAVVVITKMDRTQQDGFAVADGVVVQSLAGDVTVGQTINALMEDVNTVTKGTNYGAGRLVNFLKLCKPSLEDEKNVSDAAYALWQTYLAAKDVLGLTVKIRAVGAVDKVTGAPLVSKKTGLPVVNYKYEAFCDNTDAQRATARAAVEKYM